jgi:hypothetical protein
MTEVRFSLVHCTDGSIWSLEELDETLNVVYYQVEEGSKDSDICRRNVSEIFSQAGIQVTFAGSDFVAGPSGLWSFHLAPGFRQSSFHPKVYEWEGNQSAGPFTRWFYTSNILYFETPNGVFKLNTRNPAKNGLFKEIWKDRSIFFIHGHLHPYAAIAILDNDQVWAKDSGNGPFGDCFDWKHLSFFDTLQPIMAAVGHSYAYVLCADGLYSYQFDGQGFKLSSEEEEEEDDQPELVDPFAASKDKTFKDKLVRKIVGGEEIVLCWCEDGIYFFHCDNGATPYTGKLIHYRPRLYFPMHFFDNKKVLDVAMVSEAHAYVLCEDGVYTFGDSESYGYLDNEGEIIPQLDNLFSFERLPVFFNIYSRCLRKRANPSAGPVAKKPKP